MIKSPINFNTLRSKQVIYFENSLDKFYKKREALNDKVEILKNK